MMKRSVIWSVLILGLVTAWSCKGPDGSPSNAQIFLYLNGGGTMTCNLVATLDGGNPVTETAYGGPYTLYTNVTIGHHVIGIKGPSATSACDYDVDGGNQTITVNNPCSAISGTSGFIEACN